MGKKMMNRKKKKDEEEEDEKELIKKKKTEEEEERRGCCAVLLESLPSLEATTGPASGSVIHSYQFASCCIFFSLVFHSLTHAILLFKLLKKRQRPFFPEIHCRGLREWEDKGKK